MSVAEVAEAAVDEAAVDEAASDLSVRLDAKTAAMRRMGSAGMGWRGDQASRGRIGRS